MKACDENEIGLADQMLAGHCTTRKEAVCVPDAAQLLVTARSEGPAMEALAQQD